nr:MAG TPA: LARGE COMPONENT OF PYOCIN AP41, BACTERIOCIN, DNASE, PYOCIN, DNASE-IM.0A [Caudoviricetes sp.]
MKIKKSASEKCRRSLADLVEKICNYSTCILSQI